MLTVTTTPRSRHRGPPRWRYSQFPTNGVSAFDTSVTLQRVAGNLVAPTRRTLLDRRRFHGRSTVPAFNHVRRLTLSEDAGDDSDHASGSTTSPQPGHSAQYRGCSLLPYSTRTCRCWMDSPHRGQTPRHGSCESIDAVTRNGADRCHPD
jgi:hypothetical protein